MPPRISPSYPVSPSQSAPNLGSSKARASRGQGIVFSPPLRNQNSGHRFSGAPVDSSQRNLSASQVFSPKPDIVARRLFNGTGLTNQESDQLVKSGQDLYSEQVLDEALVRFTKAISEKDKLKAKDLPHAQAYLGAAAIFDHRREVHKALDHYLIGIRLLHNIQPASEVLAASCVRASLLFLGRTLYSYEQPIDLLKKAEAIYKRDEVNRHQLVNVYDLLKQISEKQGKKKISEHYQRLMAGIDVSRSKLFEKGPGFLSDFLEMEGMLGQDIPSSRSSVSTEPSPILDRKTSVHSSLRGLEGREAVASCIAGGISNDSLNRTTSKSMEKEGLPLDPIAAFQSRGNSPIRQQVVGVGTSPERTLYQNVGVGHVLEVQTKANSPIQQQVVGVGTSPERTLYQSVGVGHIPNVADRESSAERIDMVSAQLQTEVISVGFKALLVKLEQYQSDQHDKMAAARTLKKNLDLWIKGELSRKQVLEYIDGQFKIEKNPIFSGRLTRKLEELFLETKHRVEG